MRQKTVIGEGGGSGGGEDIGGNMQVLCCTMEMAGNQCWETSGEPKTGEHGQCMERKYVDRGGLMATMQLTPGE